MNVLTLLGKVLGYKDQVEQTVNMGEDIAKGRVGTDPKFSRITYKKDGSQYEIVTMARKIFDAKDPSVAGQAETVDVGAALNEFLENY